MRYLGQNENKELQEKFTEIELDIEFANEEREKHEAKMEVIRLKDQPIRKSLLELAAILTGFDQSQETTESLIELCLNETEQLLQSVASNDLQKVAEEMEEIGFKPVGAAFEDNFRLDFYNFGKMSFQNAF